MIRVIMTMTPMVYDADNDEDEALTRGVHDNNITARVRTF